MDLSMIMTKTRAKVPKHESSAATKTPPALPRACVHACVKVHMYCKYSGGGVEAASHRQKAGTSIPISCARAWLEACMWHGQKCVSTAYRLKCFRPSQPEAEGVTSRYDGDKKTT